MKDEKFNKLMQIYVDSTKRDKAEDLQKLRCRSEEVPRRKIPKFVWVTCAALIVIVISLSIALPIALNKDESPQYYYCDGSQISSTEANEMSEIKDKYNLDCMLPSLDILQTSINVMTYNENNQIIGASLSLIVFDEYFNDIEISIVKKPYILTSLQYYYNFSDIAQWRDATVKYRINQSSDGLYAHTLTFTKGDYSYFINFENYIEMTPTEILDLIYCEN